MIRLPKWLIAVFVIALVLGLAAPVLADSAKGKIKSLSADKNELIVTDSNGKDLTFQTNAQSKVQLNNKDSRLNDLKVGDEVTVTFDKEGDKMIAKRIDVERK
jgi:hypothetical protein